jgi:exonuclease III
MMKIITWNIRGLNGISKQRILQNCIKAENPDIRLLQETKCVNGIEEEILRRCWRHFNFTYTYSKEEVGGLSILCNPTTFILEMAYSTKGAISAHYRALGSSKSGVITNAYGPQLAQEKDHFLDNLEYINVLRGQERWILGGDFNMVLTLEEKSGGLKCLDQDSANFNHLIDKLHLINIETRNGSFTWTNKRVGTQHIARKLDCFLISENLMLEGPLIESNILPSTGSDHWAVQLWIDTISTLKYKPFFFEKFWLKHPDFLDLSRTWWVQAEIEHGSRMYKFQQRLKNSNNNFETGTRMFLVISS